MILMECIKEEIATQWVTVGTEMKEKYDNLKIEFIEYKIANDISRFFEDIRSEKSDEVLGSKLRVALINLIHSYCFLYLPELDIEYKSTSGDS